jgi:hypothetical protein
MVSILYIVLGILSSFSASMASLKFDKAVNESEKARNLNDFYSKLTSSVVYYGWVVVPLAITLILYLTTNTQLRFNYNYAINSIVVWICYAGVIVFDMLSRKHTSVFLFNVVYQLQIIFIFTTKVLFFGFIMTQLQWLACGIITATIMYIAASNTKRSHTTSKASLGVLFVILTAMFRSIAITNDGIIANKLFSLDISADFSLEWFLYETLTFVIPALIIFTMQLLIFTIKKYSLNPIRLIGREAKDTTYIQASSWSFIEYISGVAAISRLSLLGPVLQGLVPVCGIIIDCILFKKIPKLNTVIALGVLVIGCFLLTI